MEVAPAVAQAVVAEAAGKLNLMIFKKGLSKNSIFAILFRSSCCPRRRKLLMLKFALARSLANTPSRRVPAKICFRQILPHSSCTVRITTFNCSCGGISALNSMS